MKRLLIFRENCLTPGTYGSTPYDLRTLRDYANHQRRYVIYIDGQLPRDPDILRIWQRYVSRVDEQVQHE